MAVNHSHPIKSIQPKCQVGGLWEERQLDLAVNHSHPVKSIQPMCQVKGLWEETQLHLALVNHSQTVKSMQPECQVSCPQNQTRRNASENRHNWACHEVTHLLLSQQDKIKRKTMKRETTGMMDILTSYPAKKGRIVKSNRARSDIEPLTYCQANGMTGTQLKK